MTLKKGPKTGFYEDQKTIRILKNLIKRPKMITLKWAKWSFEIQKMTKNRQTLSKIDFQKIGKKEPFFVKAKSHKKFVIKL